MRKTDSGYEEIFVKYYDFFVEYAAQNIRKRKNNSLHFP